MARYGSDIPQDSNLVSQGQCVRKKQKMTVITNVKDKLIPTRTITRWRVYMDYCKLVSMTNKDHFPCHSLIKC